MLTGGRLDPGHSTSGRTAFFDLVVIDEAHGSVYQRYGAIFEWFDAMLVGLTATPKDEVDHNTYRLFHLEDGVPTDAYSLDEAVRDGWLVPPRGVAVETLFLRHGIRYADLTEAERDEWDALDWGEDDPPDEVGAEEINRFLFNEDTVDKVLATVMDKGYKVASGDRLGKTIVFAKNQAHAEFVQRRFDVGWPHLGGEFAQVITHGTRYAQNLIDAFSTTDKPPHIAISVDMLDTGIDVPEVVKLVFFKMVRSRSKFWQMIGRGTRLRPDLFGPGADDATDVLTHLAGLPSAVQDDDEDPKRFDLLVLRRQLAQLTGDAAAAERLREQVQAIAAALLGKLTIPSVAQQQELLDEVAGDLWSIDVTLPLLEHVRLRIRGLVRFVERTRRNPVYTDFADELGQPTEVLLPGVTPGTNLERFRAKASAYLRRHEDHVALQRLRRNKQLTPDDVAALEQMLLASGAGEQADIDAAARQAKGLGLFIRSLVGLDRQAAVDAFGHYLDGSRFTVDQIRFVNLIVDELTQNGVMEPGRLFESPYTDHAPTGPDRVFPRADVEVIVDILHQVRDRALPVDVA
ncbi:MAG: type I restriction-modification enzyme R subunit C-terminal domain-containing protein [Pseudonocardia sp.]